MVLDGFLSSLPGDESERIQAGGRRRRFQHGDIVFHEGDQGDTLHLVTAGRFGVQTGTSGASASCSRSFRQARCSGSSRSSGRAGSEPQTVVTLEASETRSIDADWVRDLCDRVPGADGYFLGLLADRSARRTSRLLEIVFVPAEIRVIRRIVELAATFPDGIQLTQERVGEMACTSRATVNKVLRAEQERGALVLGRETVVINDVELLRTRAARGSMPPSGPRSN
jgi:CRP/FNR family transcriptional regulator, cyclic AMP receptor protein